MPAHDTRYAIADEYLEVLYKLWEGSWDEDALLADRDSGLHADPSKIHPINHVGEHFKVEGPFLVTPSPQRTPLLFQAGSSPVGRDFCARHAEAQFIQSPSPEDARKQISETRDLLEQHGRTRDEIKFFQGLSFVVGSTEEEALRKERELEEKIDADGMVAHMGGAIGVDLGGLGARRPARRAVDRRRPGHPQLAARERRRRQPDGPRRDAPDEPAHPRGRHARADRRPPRRLPRRPGSTGSTSSTRRSPAPTRSSSTR